jgi:hypothetical protein
LAIASIIAAAMVILSGHSHSSPNSVFSDNANASNSIQYYGPFDIKHNLGQFIPEFITHPVRSLRNNADDKLQRRMEQFEYDLALLQKRSDLDAQSIAHLQSILPDQIAVKRNKAGKLEIPAEFWYALESKMRTEGSGYGGSSKDSSSTDISQLRQLETLMDMSGLWEKYLLKHRHILDSMTSEQVSKEFSRNIKEFSESSAVVSREEFVEMFQSYWRATQKEIKVEMKRLSKGLEPTDLLQRQIHDISLDVFKKQVYQSQLHGAAKAFLNIDLAMTFQRVNHFSQSTDAIIDPRLTSPNYLPPALNRGPVIRKLSSWFYRTIPRPNPAEVALQKWDEHGDCWCSPAVDDNGFGPSLGVIMGNYIIPDHVVIEHVPRTGSLEPNSAPREMEMFAMIEDEKAYYDLKHYAEYQFKERNPEGEKTPFGFVRIAKWTFDAKSVDNLQAFLPQVNMGDAQFEGRAFTNRIIIRSKNNWSDSEDGEGYVNHTCLYRVRVTGDIVNNASAVELPVEASGNDATMDDDAVI